MDNRTYKNLYKKYYPMMAKQAGLWDTVKDYGSRIGAGLRDFGSRVGSGIRSMWNRSPLKHGMDYANATQNYKDAYGPKPSVMGRVGNVARYPFLVGGGMLQATGHNLYQGMEAVGDYGSRLGSDLYNGQGWNSFGDAYNYAKSGYTPFDDKYEGERLGASEIAQDALAPTYGRYTANSYAQAKRRMDTTDYYNRQLAKQRRAAGY